eukprot:COSAG01_NODE_5256_length_4381_cov_2.177487_5_plen_55_part_00
MGGISTLDAMEAVPVGDDDRPTQPITIKKITVFVDPFDLARVSERACICVGWLC